MRQDEARIPTGDKANSTQEKIPTVIQRAQAIVEKYKETYEKNISTVDKKLKERKALNEETINQLIGLIQARANIDYKEINEDATTATRDYINAYMTLAKATKTHEHLEAEYKKDQTEFNKLIEKSKETAEEIAKKSMFAKSPEYLYKINKQIYDLDAKMKKNWKKIQEVSTEIEKLTSENEKNKNTIKNLLYPETSEIHVDMIEKKLQTIAQEISTVAEIIVDKKGPKNRTAELKAKKVDDAVNSLLRDTHFNKNQTISEHATIFAQAKSIIEKNNPKGMNTSELSRTLDHMNKNLAKLEENSKYLNTGLTIENSEDDDQSLADYLNYLCIYFKALLIVYLDIAKVSLKTFDKDENLIDEEIAPKKGM